MILRWRSEVRVVENFWGKNRDAKNCKQFFASIYFSFYRITTKHSSFDAARGNDSWHFLFYFYNSRSFRNIDQKHPKIGPHFGRRPSIYSRIFDGQNWDWNMKKLKTRVLQPKHLENSLGHNLPNYGETISSVWGGRPLRMVQGLILTILQLRNSKLWKNPQTHDPHTKKYFFDFMSPIILKNHVDTIFGCLDRNGGCYGPFSNFRGGVNPFLLLSFFEMWS